MQNELFLALLANDVLMLIWKIKSLDMFNAPLLLLKEKEMEDEVKKMNKDIPYKSATPPKFNRIAKAGNKKIKMNFSVDEHGYYGNFGGAFVPEMLYPNVKELQDKYLQIINETDFQNEFQYLLSDLRAGQRLCSLPKG